MPESNSENQGYAGAYGGAPCCKGCAMERRMQCELCGQCDELDPFDAREMMEAAGMDAGESSDDPFEYFGHGGEFSGLK